jgi:hypothetical protein
MSFLRLTIFHLPFGLTGHARARARALGHVIGQFCCFCRALCGNLAELEVQWPET